MFCLDVINEKMKTKKKYHHSGTLTFASVK